MKIFLSTTGNGVMRAERDADKSWHVEMVLAGQPITCLAETSGSNGIVYAGTVGKGVLRSTDHGRSWLPAGLAGQTVKAIRVSPHNPEVIYAGTKPALVFVSADHGLHWEELSSFRKIFSRRFWFSPAETPFTAYVQGIALSPADQNIIIVGIEAGAVVRSTDGGKTWEDHRRGALRDCHSITFHNQDGGWVYEAGGTGVGAAVSQDEGRTWTQPRTGLDRHYGWACAADPVNPEVRYVSVSPSPANAHGAGNAQAYIFRSDRNLVWHRLGGGLPQPLNHMPYALITDPHEPGYLYAGLSNGDVWASADYGDSWGQLPFNLTSVHRSMIMLS